MLKQDFISAAELGLSAQAVNATVTSNAIGTEGMSNMAINVYYTYSAGTALTMYIETTNDDLASSPDYVRKQAVAISSGTATMSDLLYSKTAGAADQDIQINIPVNDKNIRLVFAMTGSPAAADVITVNATLMAGDAR